MNNDYDQNPSGWYAPMTPAPAARTVTEEPAPRRRRMPLGWQILLNTLLALALIVFTSLYFSGRGWQPNAEKPASTREPDSGFSVTIPGEGPGGFFNILPDGGDGKEETLPEDWKDFFSSYYVTEDTGKIETRIPLAETRPDWELELAPAAKKEQSLQEIYRNCVDSIVSIRSYIDGETGYYWGTGIVLSEDGLILTNAHVIEGCDSAVVVLQNDQEFEVSLIGTDRTSDIAVLKIEAKDLTPAVFGESDALTVGEAVAAIGNPLGEEFRATLTNGIVSAIDRGVNYDGHSMNLIQTNTAINEGNSGGALLNMYGQVVGVTNMKMMSSFSSIEGIGFAIPSTTVRNVVNALIKDGEVLGRPAVGVTVGAIPDTAAEHYELPEGLYVSAVSEDSDAYAKGIREGDIITAVNGEPARTSDDILKVRNGLKVGDTINFTIWRDGESFDVDVALVEHNNIY